MLTGKWVAQDAGIGAGVDSYFEYLVKGAILLQDKKLMAMFLGKEGGEGGLFLLVSPVEISFIYKLPIAPKCLPTPEKAMAPHANTLAWKIPWMEEPGGLQSMGSLEVGHD